MTYQEIASHLVKPLLLPKSIIDSKVKAMADNIYNNSIQNKNRTYEQIYESCKSISIEYGLAYKIKGKVNSYKFNHKDPKTFYYDVSKDDIKFEVKSNYLDSKWFSYPINSLKTFSKYQSNINYMVVGSFKELDKYYNVTFKYLIKANTFFKYYNLSNFKNSPGFYNHHSAISDNQCINILQGM